MRFVRRKDGPTLGPPASPVDKSMMDILPTATTLNLVELFGKCGWLSACGSAMSRVRWVAWFF